MDMQQAMQSFNALKTLINGCEADVSKAAKGNAAAGRRVRKVMQLVKKQCQAVRAEIQQLRKEESTK